MRWPRSTGGSPTTRTTRPSWAVPTATPQFLVETYDPAQSELAGVPELASGDLGMHVLVAPTEAPIRGFTSRVFRTVMEFCFADPDVARVVVEPDVGNERILAMNAAAGFTVARNVELATKTAALSFCSREAFAGSRLGPRELAVVAPRAGSCGPASRQLWPREGTSAALVEEMYAGHLTPDLMERAQRALVAKAIAELAHERVLEPTAVGTAGTSVPRAMAYELTGPRSTYRFRARRHELDHWVLCQSSLEREVAGRPAALDAQEFAVEFAPALGIPDVLLPTYLEELASTLASSAWKLRHSSATAGDLVHADYQAIESAMTEGHPAFIANNGRIGFGSDDYAAYAPEAGRPVRLVWVAARRDKTQLSLSAGLVRGRVLPDRARGGRRSRTSPAGWPVWASPRTTISTCPCIRGSGPTSSPSRLRPTSPGTTWSASAPASTTTGRSSRSGPSSTSATRTGTT